MVKEQPQEKQGQRDEHCPYQRLIGSLTTREVILQLGKIVRLIQTKVAE